MLWADAPTIGGSRATPDTPNQRIRHYNLIYLKQDRPDDTVGGEVRLNGGQFEVVKMRTSSYYQ